MRSVPGGGGRYAGEQIYGRKKENVSAYGI